MITIYDSGETDFSTLGHGALSPISCTVNQTLNGAYTVTLVHPIDDDGMYRYIECGAILRCPVPRAVTPPVERYEQDYQTFPIYRVNNVTKTSYVRIRSGPGTNYDILGRLYNGDDVFVSDTSNPSWYGVITNGGLKGYMYAQYLLNTGRTGDVVNGSHPVSEEGHPIGPQPFRIFKVTKTLTQVEAQARHIFFDLANCPIPTTLFNGYHSPWSICKNFKVYLSEYPEADKFSFYSNMRTPYGDVIGMPLEDVEGRWIYNKNPIQQMQTDSDSYSSLFGGDFFYDWYQTFWTNSIGRDKSRECVIRYGVNMTGMTYTEDYSNVVTHIRCYCIETDGPATVSQTYISQNYIDHPEAYGQPRNFMIEVKDAAIGSKRQDGAGKVTPAIQQNMFKAAAEDEFAKNSDLPQTTLTVTYVDDELEIFLGDIVSVINTRMGVKQQLKFTQYAFDALAERYTSVTFGSIQPTLAEVVGGNK